MDVTYAGTVLELTTGLQDIVGAGDPPARPIERGTIKVQPTESEEEIRDGRFRLTVRDHPSILNPYRFLVSRTFTDPCQSVRNQIRLLQRELQVAEVDGAPNAVEFFARQLAQRRRELDRCIEQNEIQGVEVGPPLPVFRSRDLFRTAPTDRTIPDLRIFFRRLDQADFELLGFPQLITTQQMTALAQDQAPDNVSVSEVSTERDRVRIDFLADLNNKPNIRGALFLELEPSLSPNVDELITVHLADSDLFGPAGNIAEVVAEERIRLLLEPVVARIHRATNARLRNALSGIPVPDATATLTRVAVQSDGVHFSMSLGLLLGMPGDPCQSVRNRIRVLELDVRVAEQDGISQEKINVMKTLLAEERRALERCREP